MVLNTFYWRNAECPHKIVLYYDNFWSAFPIPLPGFCPHWSGVVGSNHHSGLFYHHSQSVKCVKMLLNAIQQYFWEIITTTQVILGRTLRYVSIIYDYILYCKSSLYG